MWGFGILVCAAAVALLIRAANGPGRKFISVDPMTERKIKAGIHRAGLNPKTVWK